MSTLLLNKLLERAMKVDALPRAPIQSLGRIPGGTINQNWLVSVGGKPYVVRIAPEVHHCNWLSDWEREAVTSRIAAASGLSPRVVYSDPEYQALVLYWCGDPIRPGSMTSAHLAALVAGVSSIHRLSAPAPQGSSYQGILESFLSRLGERVDPSLLARCDQIEPLLREWDRSEDLCFCHHDLNPGNLLWDGTKLRFIDWEYARIGHPLFDLASVSVGLRLNNRQKEWLCVYFDHGRFTSGDLRAAERVVEVFDRLWVEVVKPHYRR